MGRDIILWHCLSRDAGLESSERTIAPINQVRIMQDIQTGATANTLTCSRRQAVATAVGVGVSLAMQQRLRAEAPATFPAPPATQPKLPNPRSDGRLLSTLADQHEQFKQSAPKLAFDAGTNRSRFEAWRRQVRERLEELLRFPKLQSQGPARLVESQPRAGYRLEKWELYLQPSSVLPFLVLVPDGVSERSPAPAVLCFPGTGYTKEGLAGEEELPGVWRGKDPQSPRNRMAMEYVRAGLIAVAVDNPGAGELSDPIVPGLEAVALQALWSGSHYEGLSVFHKRCVLEWLRQQPMVKTGRIAVSGHSLGAKYALHLAVLDENVAALVYNDNAVNWRLRALSVSLRPTHVLQYVPGLMEWFDYTDLLAAVAPRPVLVTEGMRPDEMRRVQAAWQIHDASDQFLAVQQPRYETSSQRKYDDIAEFPTGLTYAEWNEYGYVDPRNHFFKADAAVPWLRTRLIG